LVCALLTAPSSPPVNVDVSNITSRSLNATWEPPLPANRNGVITGYRLNVTVIQDSTTIQLFSSTRSLIVNSLEPFTAYTIAVAAQTTVATGPYSKALSVMTTEDGKIKIDQDGMTTRIIILYLVQCKCIVCDSYQST